MTEFAAKIIVYAGEEDSYFSYISKEAFEFLREWMNFKEISGEVISENSWLKRDRWSLKLYEGKKKTW
ncbi:MAG TPA: hypothetical protein VFV86_05730 [Nitrososphaeraceae archaeon]|nr:hypothetical protein [Nitrososphaeraceae archaeon]